MKRTYKNYVSQKFQFVSMRILIVYTSIHSVDPMSPYSSAPQLQNMMERRGLHRPVS